MSFDKNLRNQSPLKREQTAGKLAHVSILVVALGGAAGCLAMEDDPIVESAAQTLLTDNAFSENALAYNALAYNALAYNALSVATLDPGRFDLNTVASDDLHETTLGRQLIKYTARCAYNASDLLDVPSYGALPATTYPGNLGLALTWKDGSLAQSYKSIMSACLLAHLNVDGDTVPISVRYSGAPPASQTEEDDFFFGDAVFYGDVYPATRKKYACKIRQRPATSPAATSIWDGERICDDPVNDCDVNYTGFCDQVCQDIVADGKQWRFYNCDGEGTTYEHTFSVWLEGTDAPLCGPSDTGFTCKPQ